MSYEPTDCAFDGCERTAAAKGWCSAHYYQWHKHGRTWELGSTSRGTVKPVKGCAFDGCDRQAQCAGYCNGHYRQKRRGRVLTPLGSTYGFAQVDQPTKRSGKSKLPPGWGKKLEPAKPRASVDASILKEIPIVSETPEHILAAARDALRRHGAEDLAEMLGVVA